MRQVTVTIRGISPYSASKMHDAPKLDKEGHEDYDKRTWREKCNTDKAGNVVIPAMAFKQALPVACRKLGLQIAGKGKATYTKFFEADVICLEDAPLGVHKDDVIPVTINANADGVRGSGKRVRRIFPVVPEWRTKAVFAVLDNTVTNKVFEQVMHAAGMGVGVGRFRPENGGINGRFVCEAFEWGEA